MDSIVIIEFYFKLGMSDNDSLLVRNISIDYWEPGHLLVELQWDTRIDFIVDQQLEESGRSHLSVMYLKCKQHRIPIWKENMSIGFNPKLNLQSVQMLVQGCSSLQPLWHNKMYTKSLRRRLCLMHETQAHLSKFQSYHWDIDRYQTVPPVI